MPSQATNKAVPAIQSQTLLDTLNHTYPTLTPWATLTGRCASSLQLKQNAVEQVHTTSTGSSASLSATHSTAFSHPLPAHRGSEESVIKARFDSTWNQGSGRAEREGKQQEDKAHTPRPEARLHPCLQRTPRHSLSPSMRLLRRIQTAAVTTTNLCPGPLPTLAPAGSAPSTTTGIATHYPGRCSRSRAIYAGSELILSCTHITPVRQNMRRLSSTNGRMPKASN